MTSARALRTLLTVAECGGFAAAAERVGLTPAGVSQQMRSLEETVGYKLFDRQGRTVALNERGMRFLGRARRVLIQLDELLTSNGEDVEPVGNIAVEAVATSMSLLVRAALAGRPIYPRLTIRPAIGYSANLTARVEVGEINAAIAVKSTRPIASGTFWTPLYREPLVFVANKRASKKLDMRRLMRERLFLRPSSNTHTGAMIDRFLKANKIVFHEVLEMNLLRTLVEMVEMDAGVTVLPLIRGSQWEKDPNLRIERLDHLGGQREIGFLENERTRELTRHLKKLILKKIEEDHL